MEKETPYIQDPLRCTRNGRVYILPATQKQWKQAQKK